jgi:hypothetical protein
VHDLGGWNAVVVLTALAFAATFVLLNRALLRHLEPLRALLITVLAVLMAVDHLLARPFVLALPVLTLWMIGIVRAADERRAPSLWLLPLMTLWANMHGGFTLGIAIAAAFAGEAVLDGWGTGRLRNVVRGWGLFLLLAAGAALITPHGPRGLWFTWQVLAEDTYALDRIGEWASPNFHRYQSLQLWLLGGLALVLWQGLRLPLVRLVLVLGLLHLALKHVRNVELLGLISALVVAAPFGSQWKARRAGAGARARDDALLQRLARPAGPAACAVAVLAAGLVALGAARLRPVELPAFTVPAKALAAARQAGLQGPVLNDYGWGGYLIYAGIPPFIDGRSDMYRDAFLREYFAAIELETPEALPATLDKRRIAWTLLRPGTPALAVLDRLPGWRRVYADANAVIHARSAP